jgi:hypothetical protein
MQYPHIHKYNAHRYLPHNTTSKTQPLDQYAFANLNKRKAAEVVQFQTDHARSPGPYEYVYVYVGCRCKNVHL